MTNPQTNSPDGSNPLLDLCSVFAEACSGEISQAPQQEPAPGQTPGL